MSNPTNRDDGGPAFPVIGAPGAPEDYPGMSRRDWLAGLAMQAMPTNTSLMPVEDVASVAYEYPTR